MSFAAKLESPFHHCSLCSKAYSSEKSLNKHLRKKHAIAITKDARHSAKEPSDHEASTSPAADKLASNPDSASSEDRLPSKDSLLSLTVPLTSRSFQGGSSRRPPTDDDVMIICPECGGTIKSKKGVAKHYMCFHNVVYTAWKGGWFGRSVRLMDLTQDMIRDFYTNGGSRRSKANTTDGTGKSSEAAAELKMTEDKDELTGMVLDSVDEADDSNLSTSGLLRISAKPEASTLGHRQAVKPSGHQTAGTSFRSRRSKLKTQLATTAPFFIGKEGKLEFNTNENPLDINCPFCVTHKTTIKGLAKHCVNHHPSEYADWKSGNFGSVQLRYVRPNSAIISQTLGEFQQSAEAASTACKASPLRAASPPARAPAKVTQSISQQPQGTNAKPGDLEAVRRAATGAPGSHSWQDDADSGSVSVTPPPDSAAPAQSSSKEAKASAASLNLFDDDKQATPCPFCGELIFSKGMGKHCIYFHHDQYQEWKTGKFGSVPLRFVPNQVGIDSSEPSERALKRREARKKNGISITLPLMENGQQSATPTPDAVDTSTAGVGAVTLRIKPSLFRGEIYRCGECDRVFDKSSSLSQHLRIHKYGPSMSKHGFQTKAPWTDDTEGSVGELLDDDDDEDLVFACHYCECAFDSVDELKQHFGQKHPDDRGLFVISEAAAAGELPGEDAEAASRAVRFVCDLCHVQHRTRRGLSRHYQGHQMEKFSSVLFDERSEAAATPERGEREPGELSPARSMDESTASSRQPPDKYFCGVCLSCFPSARSLAQHNRVHKFGGGAASASAANQASDDDGADDGRAVDVRADAAVVCVDDDDKSADDGADSNEAGDLQISDAGGWAVVQEDSAAKAGSLALAAGCPKCHKAFRNKWFLRDHLGRCFAKALADGELEMRDLAVLAGVPGENEVEEEEQTASGGGGSPDAGKTLAEASTRGAFECRQCGKAFSSQANLQKHNVVHTGSSVSCRTCLREFKMPCHLARHFCSALIPDKQTATTGSDSLLQQKQLRLQQQRQHRQQQQQQQHHRQHQQQPPDDPESEGSFECDLCHRNFQYAGNLTVHKRFCQQHGSTEEAPAAILLDCEDEVHECSLCNETFIDRDSLEEHATNCSLKPAASRAGGGQQQRPPGAQTERERIPCPNCFKTYCRKDVLEAHMKTSCRGSPASVGASAAFGIPPAAKRPRQDGGALAASDRALSFRCELCPSQFSSSLGLVVHRSKCHPQFYGPGHRRSPVVASSDTAGGEVECDNCLRRFSKAMHLGKHRLTCLPPAFSNSGGAAAEVGSQQQQQPPPGDQGPLLSLPNRCPHCPRAFLTAGRLREHAVAAHGRFLDVQPTAPMPLTTIAVVAPAMEADVDTVTDDGGLLLDDADVDDEGESEKVGQPGQSAVETPAAMAAVGPEDDEALNVEYPEADAYLCSECDRSYPTFDLFNRHLKEAHEIDSIAPELPEAKEASTEHVLQPMQLTAVLTGARKRKSTPVPMC